MESNYGIFGWTNPLMLTNTARVYIEKQKYCIVEWENGVLWEMALAC